MATVQSVDSKAAAAPRVADAPSEASPDGVDYMAFASDVNPKLKKKLMQLLKKYDVDGDGKFDKHEVAAIVTDLIDVQDKESKLAMVTVVLLVTVLLLAGAMFGAVLIGNEATKEAKMEGSTMSVKGSEDIVRVGPPAQESLPMYVLPALPDAMLSRVRDVCVKLEAKSEDTTEVKNNICIQVGRFDRMSDTHVRLYGLDKTDYLNVENGQARFVDSTRPDQPSEGERICSSDVQCSAIKVTATDFEQYSAQIDAALATSGVASQNGRRLWSEPLPDFEADSHEERRRLQVAYIEEQKQQKMQGRELAKGSGSMYPWCDGPWWSGSG